MLYHYRIKVLVGLHDTNDRHRSHVSGGILQDIQAYGGAPKSSVPLAASVKHAAKHALAGL